MSARLDAAIAELAAALRAEIYAQVREARADAPERLLSVAEAATALGLGRSKVYGEISAGRLQTLKVGRRRLVPQTAIAQYIRAADR